MSRSQNSEKWLLNYAKAQDDFVFSYKVQRYSIYDHIRKAAISHTCEAEATVGVAALKATPKIKWICNTDGWREITWEGRGFPPGTPRSCWCQFSPRCRTAGREAGHLEPGPSRCLAS